MILLETAILSRLARSKLLTTRTVASSGPGDRRSRLKGAGIEFEDHRNYQPGDDVRRLDHHVYARLGQSVVRQFAVNQSLGVTILVDASSSMAFGQPPKSSRALQLAAVLAYVGLAGGDRVQVGAYRAGRVIWMSSEQGRHRAMRIFQWLGTLKFRGTTGLLKASRSSLANLPSAGLLIVISDWLDEDAMEALRTWHAANQELVVVHLLAPEEEEPDLLGKGTIRVVDAETGVGVDTSLDSEVLERYRRKLGQWKSNLAHHVLRLEGRYLPVRSDDDLRQTLFRDWRKRGLIS